MIKSFPQVTELDPPFRLTLGSDPSTQLSLNPHLFLASLQPLCRCVHFPLRTPSVGQRVPNGVRTCHPCLSPRTDILQDDYQHPSGNSLAEPHTLGGFAPRWQAVEGHRHAFES